LHLVAKSISTRSGKALTGNGSQLYAGSTHGAFDQSWIDFSFGEA